MKSKNGRAFWIAERAMDHQDPGAAAFHLMLKSAAEYLAGHPAKQGGTEDKR